MSFEQERLRILEMVSNGELTPQEGHLRIAMAKVSSGQDAPDGAAETATAGEPGVVHVGEQQRGQDERGRDIPFGAQWPFGATEVPPPRLGPLVALMALPLAFGFVLLGLGLAFVLALPTFVAVMAWNAFVVSAHPTWPSLGLGQTLAAVVLLVLVGNVLVWGRRLRVAIRSGGTVRGRSGEQ